MRGTKSVIFAFVTPRKSGNTALHTQFAHAFTAAGKNFVSISLMSDIPYQTIIRRVKNIMQGDSQLDRTKIGR